MAEPEEAYATKVNTPVVKSSVARSKKVTLPGLLGSGTIDHVIRSLDLVGYRMPARLTLLAVCRGFILVCRTAPVT